ERQSRGKRDPGQPMFCHSATPISFQTPGPPWRPSAEGNSTLKADTFLFLVKSHLKKHKGLFI
ncbi:MAG TPA: hypothetical protein VIZ19_07215, partial [Roseiarcus sp.]